MISPINIFILFASLLWTGCTSSIASGGSSSTVGNPVVMATVTYKDAPLSNASVYLLEPDSIYSEKNSNLQLKTDSLGQIAINLEYSKTYRLSVIANDNSSAIIYDLPKTEDDTVDISLTTEKMGIIKFELAQDITVLGTPFIDNNSSSISVPQGNIPLITSINELNKVADTLAVNIIVTNSDTVTVKDRIASRLVVPTESLGNFDTISAVATDINGEIFAISQNQLFRQNTLGINSSKIWNGKILGSITSLNNNQTWIGTDSGLITISQSEYSIISSENTYNTDTDTSLALGSINDILFVANEFRFYKVINSIWSGTEYPTDLISKIIKVEPITENLILIGTQTDGFWTLDLTSTAIWTHYNLSDIGFSDNNIIDFAKMNDHEVWICNSNEIGIWQIGDTVNISHSTRNSDIRDIEFNQRSNILYLLESRGLYTWGELGWDATPVLELDQLSYSVLGLTYSREVLAASKDGILAIQVIKN